MSPWRLYPKDVLLQKWKRRISIQTAEQYKITEYNIPGWPRQNTPSMHHKKGRKLVDMVFYIQGIFDSTNEWPIMHLKMRTQLGYFCIFRLFFCLFWSKRASFGPFSDRIYWPAFVRNTYFNEEFDYWKVANSCELTDMAIALFVGKFDKPAVSTGGGGGGSAKRSSAARQGQWRPAMTPCVNRNHECTENGKENAQKTVTTVHKNQ